MNETMNLEPKSRGARHGLAKFPALAACALLLAACGGGGGGSAYDYTGDWLYLPIYVAATGEGSWNHDLPSPDYVFIFTAPNADIRAIDGKKVSIGRGHWLLKGDRLQAAWIGGQNSNYYRYYRIDEYRYDSARLTPGIHQIGIGQLVTEMNGTQMNLITSAGADVVVATFEGQRPYLADIVQKGDRAWGIIVQSSCPEPEAHYEYKDHSYTSKCYAEGLVVGSSDPLFIGLTYNETRLDFAEIRAIQKARTAEGTKALSESMAETMKDFPLFGGGSGQ